MKPKFALVVEEFRVIREIEGSWTSDDFKKLLELMEFEQAAETSDEDLREFCLMSLQDLKPRDAARLVLGHRLGDSLNAGQIENVSHEMLDEKLWEEFADVALHERMFHVGSLLHQVSPGSFPVPDAVCVQLVVTAENGPARELLAGSINESLVVRLIADGMDDSSTLRRMFGEQLSGNAFPEADKIIWTIAVTTESADVRRIEIVSSGLWLDALRDTRSFDSAAHADS